MWQNLIFWKTPGITLGSFNYMQPSLTAEHCKTIRRAEIIAVMRYINTLQNSILWDVYVCFGMVTELYNVQLEGVNFSKWVRIFGEKFVPCG